MRPPGADRLRRHLGEPQHRNAYLLLANTALAAAAGLAFWLVLTRALGLDAAEVGVGYATVALGTTVGVLAKGGLDTALLRAVPRAGRGGASRLLAFAAALGCGTALLVAAALSLAAAQGGSLSPLGGRAWAAAAAIGALLVLTWLQDAYFLAERDAGATLWRTLAASAVRVALPFLLVAWAVPDPVAAAWAAALAASALAGLALARRLPAREGEEVPRSAFLASAARNGAGSAAEFLPGLLLAPLVLAIDGPAAAAHFGMAWTVASLLFLAAAAVGRSALAEMARPGAPAAPAVRRGAAQILAIVGPAAVAGIALAPAVLGLFGPGYAEHGALPFALLCASAVAVAPSSLYLAVLRARDRTLPLVAFPLATVLLLLVLAPTLEARWGLPGVAAAWGLANLPTGAWAAAGLLREARGVSPLAARPVGGPPHLE